MLFSPFALFLRADKISVSSPTRSTIHDTKYTSAPTATGTKTSRTLLSHKNATASFESDTKMLMKSVAAAIFKTKTKVLLKIIFFLEFNTTIIVMPIILEDIDAERPLTSKEMEE